MEILTGNSVEYIDQIWENCHSNNRAFQFMDMKYLSLNVDHFKVSLNNVLQFSV